MVSSLYVSTHIFKANIAKIATILIRKKKKRVKNGGIMLQDPVLQVWG